MFLLNGSLEGFGFWSDQGENSGTFSLKIGKTLHPEPPNVRSLPPRKTFCRKPYIIKGLAWE
ncbi:MAG: hypothetical protein EWV55_05505 [Microcystis viridis Mv_BB_P_19951000_S69]|nr:MAG: hypothetical protein EWV47_11295 [Microcystis viridis Mv_BB_P_19951000_S68]TRU77165.1 MAG: hypothetical protein EWV55_05505 [Microcystis viridis Mv_BB_P_19951000_S69]TRU81072.1 MAG: hypothetical protein EWV46_21885 [Microcystis viridis Mv_BB_P_19951000_S69D]